MGTHDVSIKFFCKLFRYIWGIPIIVDCVEKGNFWANLQQFTSHKFGGAWVCADCWIFAFKRLHTFANEITAAQAKRAGI